VHEKATAPLYKGSNKDSINLSTNTYTVFTPLQTNNDQDCERSVKTKGQGEWSQAKERENQRQHEIELGLIEHKASIRKNTKRARLRV
jgi:hypothetical protein